MRTFVVIFLFCLVETFGFRVLYLCQFHPAGCELPSREKCLEQVNVTDDNYEDYPTITGGYRKQDYLLNDNKEIACQYELCMKKAAEIINDDGVIDVELASKKFSIGKKYREEYIAGLQRCQAMEIMCDKLQCLTRAHFLPNNGTMTQVAIGARAGRY